MQLWPVDEMALNQDKELFLEWICSLLNKDKESGQGILVGMDSC